MATESSVDTQLVEGVGSITLPDSSVSDLLTQICNGANKLLTYVSSMVNVVQEVKETDKRVQRMLDGITADSDQEVRYKLLVLHRNFATFILDGNNFLKKCLSMAKYAGNKRHIKIIKEQLESQVLDELQVYITSLSKYLKDCEESFKPTSYKNINDQISSARRYFSDKLEEAKKEASDAVEKYEKAVERKALTTAFSVASSAVAGATGILLPEVAVLESLFNYFQTYFASTNEGTADEDDVMKQRRAQVETAKEKMLLDALNRVAEEDWLQAESLGKDMKSHLDCASKEKKGLQECADFNKEDVDFCALEIELDRLQRAVDNIVVIIMEDRVTLNTQPHQATTMQYVENTSKPFLNVHIDSESDSENDSEMEYLESEYAKQESGNTKQSELVLNTPPHLKAIPDSKVENLHESEDAKQEFGNPM